MVGITHGGLVDLQKECCSPTVTLILDGGDGILDEHEHPILQVARGLRRRDARTRRGNQRSTAAEPRISFATLAPSNSITTGSRFTESPIATLPLPEC